MACLVLHFDINKTIIMSDIGAGRDIYGTLNSLLSECVWGVYDASIPVEKRVPSDWQICCESPCAHSPVVGAVTFGTFLEDHTSMIKKDRTAIKTTFTNPGSIGERFRQYLLDIQNAMMLPSAVDINSSCADLFQSGCYHILPSFFAVIRYLVENNINFRIVFRTFGVDIPAIAREFNLFCEGHHPYFSLPFPVDGSHSTYKNDLRLHLPDGSGKLIRTQEGPEGVQLAYVSQDKTVQIVQGYKEVDDVIRNKWLGLNSTSSTLKSLNTVAVRDDFPWWHNVNSESCTSGKLFLVNRTKDNTLVEIFFDDNIERDRAHIVDVRDRVTFEPVPYVEAVEKRFLHKVEPYYAIMDKEYFVNIVKEIVAANPSLIRAT